MELRTNEKSATKNADGDDLPTFKGHIYADANSQFPVQLNEWERKVIATEIARPSFVAWYGTHNGPRLTRCESHIRMKAANGHRSRVIF